MNKLLFVEIESGGILRIEAQDNSGKMHRVNQADEIQDTDPTLPVVVGVNHIFRITNFHFCDNYVISCINGTYVLVGDYIHYTAAAEGYGEIKVNGTILPFMVLSNQPLMPEITYPEQGAIDLPDGFEITTSPFVSADPNMVHVATHWQIATDPNFTDLVYDQTSTTDLVDLVTFGLDEGTPYYIRAQHIGEVT